jgi:hypothetical protein
MAARPEADAPIRSRRALLAAAAGAAALAAGSAARPLGVRADTGDPVIQGQYNLADATTTLESSAATALAVEGAQFGLSAMGEAYGISATTEGTTGGWPRAIIANGNEGATGLHAASWAPGGGGGWGDGDAVVAETRDGKALRGSAMGTGYGLYAESAQGHGAFIRGSGERGLNVEGQTGGINVTTVGGHAIRASGDAGIHVDARGESGPTVALSGTGYHDGEGVHGSSIQGEAGTAVPGAGFGVVGESGTGIGVFGLAHVSGTAVTGKAIHGVGVSAESEDGIGLSASGTETAIHAMSPRAGLIANCERTGDFGVAVLGHGMNDAVGVVGRCLAGTAFDVGGTQPGVSGDSGSGPGVEGKSLSGPGVTGSSTSGPGAHGTSQTGSGVHGESDSSSGVRGESTSGSGVSGMSEAAVGVLGEGGSVGVFGASPNAGVVGASHVPIDGVTVPVNVGVYGYAPVDTGGRGVQGRAVAGRGVHGLATTGQGTYGQATTGQGVRGYATSGTAGYFATSKPTGEPYAGYAIRAFGRVKLDHCAGVATIAKGAKSVDVPLAIDLVSTAAVVATLQGSAGAGVTVERVALLTGDNRFTIHLTEPAAAQVKVAWIVLG